ncbi:unnamed protein product [Polarella glacialis]|uniref:Uncharacterized protein n=1 Tax=Polarella glacialis TaxID=89957 RepID=A0A813L0M9_POLGL|nr:unnamed protein product [Polarella glacialis]
MLNPLEQQQQQKQQQQKQQPRLQPSLSFVCSGELAVVGSVLVFALSVVRRGKRRNSRLLFLQRRGWQEPRTLRRRAEADQLEVPPENPWAAAAPTQGYLLAVEAAVVLSGLFMVLWVLLLPGSAWMGSSVEHDEWVKQVYDQHFSFFAPSSLLLKYSQTIELTHALPGAVWCLLAPLQLTAAGRKFAGSAGHKLAGRLMLVAASVLMVGYALIDQANLSAEVVDFQGQGGIVAASADALNRASLGGVMPPFNLGGMRVLAAWFVHRHPDLPLGAVGAEDRGRSGRAQKLGHAPRRRRAVGGRAAAALRRCAHAAGAAFRVFRRDPGGTGRRVLPLRVPDHCSLCACSRVGHRTAGTASC